MSKRIMWTNIAALTVMLGLTSDGFAEDQLLPGTPDEVHDLFNGLAARADFENRMSLKICSGENVHTCQYSVTGKLAVIAAAPKGNPDKLESIIVINTGRARPIDMVITMSILITMYSPEITAEKRAKVMSQLASALKNSSREKEVSLGRITYKLKDFGAPTGLWFIVSSQ